MTRISSVLVLATAMAFLSVGPLSSSAAVLPTRDMASQDHQDATIADLSNNLVTRAVDAKQDSDIQNKKQDYGSWCDDGYYWDDYYHRCRYDHHHHHHHHRRDEVDAERDGQEIEELVARHDSYGGYGGHGHDDGGYRHGGHHHHGHHHYRGDTIEARDAEHGGRFTDEVDAADRGGGGGRGRRSTDEVDAADRGGGGGRGRRSTDEVDAADRGGGGGRGRRSTDEVDAADRGGGGGRGGRFTDDFDKRDSDNSYDHGRGRGDRGRGDRGRGDRGRGDRGRGRGRHYDSVDAEDEE